MGETNAGAEMMAGSNHGLDRQLTLRDLVLTQILTVVGSAWVGIAAGLGRAQAVVWMMAMVGVLSTDGGECLLPQSRDAA